MFGSIMKNSEMNQSNLTSVLRGAALLTLLTVGGVAGAQTNPSPATATKPVVTLGALSVDQGEVEKMLQTLPPGERTAIKNDPSALQNWLRQRVTSEAVLREARSKGWADRPEVKARIEAAVAEVTNHVIATTFLDSLTQVPADYPSDTEIKAAYEQNKVNFNLPPRYRVAQIYLPTDANDAVGNKKIAKQATTLAKAARKGDFAELAKAESKDQATAARGGEVGTLALTDMLPEVREVVVKLKTGEVSDPIQAVAGIRIIKLLDVQPARMATPEEMKPLLQQALRQQRQQQLVQTYLSGLAPADQVTIDTIALDAALKKIN